MRSGSSRIEPVAVEQDRAHAERAGALDVVRVRVADHHRLGGGDAERREGPLEDRGVRLRPAVALRAHRDVDVEQVVARELLEVALAVRDQPDPEPVAPHLLEHGHGIVVEVEVGVVLPAPHDLDGAGPRPVGVAAHATHDVLGERDPDLLVVDELGMGAQTGERSEPRLLVAVGIEA